MCLQTLSGDQIVTYYAQNTIRLVWGGGGSRAKWSRDHFLYFFYFCTLPLGDVNSGKSTLARNLISNINKVANLNSLQNKKIHLVYCYEGEAGIMDT